MTEIFTQNLFLCRIKSFNSDICIFHFPLKGIMFPSYPYPMAQVISAEDITGYPVTEWISARWVTRVDKILLKNIC